MGHVGHRIAAVGRSYLRLRRNETYLAIASTVMFLCFAIAYRHTVFGWVSLALLVVSVAGLIPTRKGHRYKPE